uniref:Uncharacterized protein n=1 Tax=Rhizophora mucronata TaxID=61149 RepID=A0A2P2PX14_RHIMU
MLNIGSLRLHICQLLCYDHLNICFVTISTMQSLWSYFMLVCHFLSFLTLPLLLVQQRERNFMCFTWFYVYMFLCLNLISIAGQLLCMILHPF